MGSHGLPALLAAAGVGAASLAAVQLLLRRVARAQAAQHNGADADASSAGMPPLRGATPHPGWHPPLKQPAPFASNEMRAVDPSQLPSDVLYPLIISAIVPRPIAFVSTQSAAGEGNLAPFSYFNVVAHAPPHVVIGFASSRLRSHGRKDTLVNILETGEFVVNIMSEWFVEAANHCCGNFDYGEDEMQLSGLTPRPSVKVRPPRVAESAVHMECLLRHNYEVKNAAGDVTGTIVIGEVVMMHVHEGVAGRSPSGKLVVDIEKYKPVSRLGGNTYARTSGLFDLPRPDRGPKQQELRYTSAAT
ncbi:Flavin reductase-FMN-binding domain containing [Micractinium conductrix]|uniref:Flavin reductase-FMN-binding domain containing n=1 Tax=Micractinium conductrix TaxID=554055 RepID=A0A2P6VCT5_9CHLO|nr:Flavin reductase-FMN-binding domain containing [Micractinium conductrix]|eukprot:PSC71889.1 Flavin reductase-FMN-binding domain containing [Micractinium conductrix]